MPRKRSIAYCVERFLSALCVDYTRARILLRPARGTQLGLPEQPEIQIRDNPTTRLPMKMRDKGRPEKDKISV